MKSRRLSKTNDRQIILAWCVMFAGWAASMMAWKLSSNPLVDLTIKNLIIMAALLIIAFRPETALPVLLHGAVILGGYGACRDRLLGWRDHGGSVASVNSGALSRKAKG